MINVTLCKDNNDGSKIKKKIGKQFKNETSNIYSTWICLMLSHQPIMDF